ncbi:ABC transporter permease [Piscinibacter sp. XHJ-5]|uniref:ABC transporter permease n=1 Tax=Piscinibacter sp. XHJ-5 TaxID=3037797 RepID=UPI0024528E49|nr:ABC transporter permease [Piscinibacter sp. XHJ-5]
MLLLLRQLSWPELRHHPWRHLAALLAVVLGVALAFSVQLINQSALHEFAAAVRSVNGQPDFELRSQRGGFDEALYARVATHPQVAVASPVIEIDTVAFDERGEKVPLRVLGLDALVAAPLSPALIPRLADGVDRLALLDPGMVFLNEPARRRLPAIGRLRLQSGTGPVELQVGGSIAAGGLPLAVMDIAGAQSAFGWLGRLTRIDVRLVPGAQPDAVLRELPLPPGVRAASPEESAQRVSNVSRAYRVNLTVLALVALFTGAFLVFSILSLSVAKRQQQLALLGVLGLSGRERLQLVLAESALLGVVGSALGLALGTALAALALRLLAGDLGGGYFPGVAPALEFGIAAALAYGALGVAAAVVGGWLPARQAQRLAPAQALKGLGTGDVRPGFVALGPVLLLAGVGLALLPPIADVPLAAYAAVACLLLGGIACVPLGVSLLLKATRPPHHPLALLAVERARHQRDTATVAVAGVVASLSLAVALTVMVASFRASVTQWLDELLPADLYARAVATGAAGDVVVLPSPVVEGASRLPGVARVELQRSTSVVLDPRRPAVGLLARRLADPARELPLVGELLPAPPGEMAAYVSEAMVSVYGAAPGTRLALPLPDGSRATLFVRGVWRDYARQHGAVALALADYRRLTRDQRINELALWLAPGARAEAVQQALRDIATRAGLDPALLEFAAPAEIRASSLRIFDRSFAVTYWLQAVAIAIGLFGIAASFSAQVLARRKEFGLLAHLGLTRAQILGVVAAEGAVWTAAGALVGLLLGLAVSVVLVHVVNPQSFHWTMDLLLPWGRLALLCAAVVMAGTLTAWLAARSAAGAHMALAVKEDW